MIPASENDSYYEVAYKARKQTVISAKNLMEKHPELMSEYTKVKIGELRADYPQICEELSEQAGDENRSMKIRKKKLQLRPELFTGREWHSCRKELVVREIKNLHFSSR